MIAKHLLESGRKKNYDEKHRLELLNKVVFNIYTSIKIIKN